MQRTNNIYQLREYSIQIKKPNSAQEAELLKILNSLSPGELTELKKHINNLIPGKALNR